MKTFTTILLLVVTSFSISAQKANDTLQAYQYYQTADSLLQARKLNHSMVYYKKALPIYEKAEAWERVVTCYIDMSEGFRFDYKLDEALKNAQTALEFGEKKLARNHKTLEESYVNLGIVYEDLVDYKNALSNYTKGLDINLSRWGKEHPKSGYIYNNLAGLYYRKGDLQKAEEYITKTLVLYDKSKQQNLQERFRAHNTASRIFSYKGNLKKALYQQEKSLDITIQIYGTEHVETAYCYHDLGIIHRKLGSYNKSLINIKKTISILKKEKDIPALNLALIYNNLGVLFKYKKEYHQALTNYKKGLRFIEKENYPDEISLLYSNIAFALNEIGSHKKAYEYINKSLELRKKTFPENHPYIAECNKILGYISTKQSDFDKALHHHYIALDSHKNTFGDHSLYVADSYNDIAENLVKKEKLSEAISTYDLALKSNAATVNDTIQFNPAYYLNWEVLLVSLKGIANVQNMLYRSNDDIKFLKKASSTYKNADQTIKYVRQNLSEYKDKVTFGDRSKDIYSDAIKMLVSSSKNNNSQDVFDQSFYYAEQSKSNTLKELLNISIANNFSGISKDLITLETTLKTDKAFYQSNINKELSKKEKDSAKITEFENKLFTLNRTQDSLTTILEKNYPNYYQLKYQNDVVAIKDIQNQLDKNTTVLEFFVTDSISYAFTISKNKFAVKELSTPNLVDQVQKFQSVTEKNIVVFKNNLHQLYEDIVLPIKDQLVGDQLIIVPDGPLWHINFDLLLTQPSSSNNPKTWFYLVKQYANSATLLFSKNKMPEPNNKELKECLAFSFSSNANTANATTMSLKTLRNANSDLPGTREEIKTIAHLMNGQYFYGNEASELNFKKHAGRYTILHLALHGTVDNERPENSKLFFTKNKDSIEDGFLHSNELFALNIPAELTVLSACNTGSGKIAKGEGIMSLGNAFQYAGTKSLLLTNWEVSDQTTPQIMKYFYTNLKNGKNKAKALQQAKIQYLASTNEVNNHPFYWGGFYLLGDTAPVQLNSSNYAYWIIAIGSLILLFGLFWWYKKKV